MRHRLHETIAIIFVLSNLAAFANLACRAGAEKSGGSIGLDGDVVSDSVPPLDVHDPLDAGDGSPDACATATIGWVHPAVDVVMIVDQSGSMGDEMASVQANVNRLAAYLDATRFDYRVVMIARKGGICVPPPLGDGS